jgi:ATP-dependent protease Clp ATPase subunit
MATSSCSAVLRQESAAGQEAHRRTGVYICDECIDLCNEIIDEELTAPAQLDLDNAAAARRTSTPS